MDAGNAQMTDEDAAKAFERVGGPAYPCQWSLPEGGHLNCPGMTLRDWFAGQALVALAPYIDVEKPDLDKAALLYALADAMLAERAKGGA